MGDHSPKPIRVYPLHSFYKHAKGNSIVECGRSGYGYYKQTSPENITEILFSTHLSVLSLFPLALNHRTVYQGPK